MDNTLQYKRKIERSGLEYLGGRKMTDVEWTDFMAEFEETLDAAGDAILDALREKFDSEV